MNEEQDRETGSGDSTTDTLLYRIAAPAGSPLPLPRLLVVLAHSDDEVLAMGGRLERLKMSRVLTVTDGAPANGDDAQHHGFATLAAYRAARVNELLAALADAGLGSETAPAFAWAVPDQAASFHLTKLANALAEEIELFTPEAILTHPYEGGHPDHDACAFAVHAAVQIAGRRNAERRFVPVFEAPSYHADGRGGMATGEFLGTDQTKSLAYGLTSEEQARKRRRLAAFVSQAETLAQFRVDREMFREAPAYNFLEPPHPGQLFYEQFPWGMTGERFCQLARKALQQIFGTTGLEQTEAPRDRVTA